MVNELESLLKVPIPDDIIGMSEHARRVDGYRYIVAMDIVSATKKLTEEKNRFQLIKTKTMTDVDRKNYTEFHTRDAQEGLDRATYTLQCIDKRINLIQTLIKPETEMMKRT